jgi:methylphosphotriester-DNA--protein-cysteine methyltransferase
LDSRLAWCCNAASTSRIQTDISEEEKHSDLQKMTTDPKELVDILSEISSLTPKEYQLNINSASYLEHLNFTDAIRQRR